MNGRTAARSRHIHPLHIFAGGARHLDLAAVPSVDLNRSCDVEDFHLALRLGGSMLLDGSSGMGQGPWNSENDARAHCGATEIAVISVSCRHGSCPRHRGLGSPYDMVVQVKFIVPGALPQLFEHRAGRIACQRLADVFMRAANDRQARLASTVWTAIRCSQEEIRLRPSKPGKARQAATKAS